MKSISRTMSIKNNLAVLVATTPNTTLDLTSNTTKSNGSVSSSISTISSRKPPGNESTITSTTINQLESESAILATSTSNSTVGNISTHEIGGGGGADGLSSSYYVFVLIVIGACVLKVPEV